MTNESGYWAIHPKKALVFAELFGVYHGLNLLGHFSYSNIVRNRFTGGGYPIILLQ